MSDVHDLKPHGSIVHAPSPVAERYRGLDLVSCLLARSLCLNTSVPMGIALFGMDPNFEALLRIPSGERFEKVVDVDPCSFTSLGHKSGSGVLRLLSRGRRANLNTAHHVHITCSKSAPRVTSPGWQAYSSLHCGNPTTRRLRERAFELSEEGRTALAVWHA